MPEKLSIQMIQNPTLIVNSVNAISLIGLAQKVAVNVPMTF